MAETDRRVEHRSQQSGWQTPEPILYRVRQLGDIVLDPATTKENPTRAQYIRTPMCDPDGLETRWSEFGGLVFVNPPYGRGHNPVWGRKIGFEGHMHGTELIALVAVRPGSKWWRSMWTAQRICFVDHRIKFVGAPSGAPFDSALCYWGTQTREFREAMKDLGRVIRP